MTLYEELQARGLVAQITDNEIIDLINNGKATFYIGFDCTADSLTAGHFMALTLMKPLEERRSTVWVNTSLISFFTRLRKRLMVIIIITIKIEIIIGQGIVIINIWKELMFLLLIILLKN